MARKLYGPGAHGGTVGDIQRALLAAKFDPNGIDEFYEKDTTAAVKAFQQASKLAATGFVDEDTWTALMQRPVPGTDVRSLDLTAAFEGHGYSLAEGNWDGAWLTWGIIGFTMKAGKVQKIILNILSTNPQRIAEAFGDKADQLIGIMKAPPSQQEQWANSVTVRSGVAEPWRTGFRWLGQFQEVREEQRRMANTDYFLPALNTAKGLGLKSELGLALCFDVEVQNGGVSDSTRKIIQQGIAAQHPSNERDLRRIVANAVAGASDPRFKQDVLSRKLTIADGQGQVHGAAFILENWALAEFAA
jgi:peptidoglycan hydrolase-like protein with peptidoglycan-binding domain